MICKQVIFREADIDEARPFMGIRVDNEGIICAECGGFLKTEDVDIIEEYPDWIDFTEEIAGKDFFQLLEEYDKEGK